MEVHVYSVKAKSQVGNTVKYIMTTQKGPSQKNSARNLRDRS